MPAATAADVGKLLALSSIAVCADVWSFSKLCRGLLLDLEVESADIVQKMF